MYAKTTRRLSLASNDVMAFILHYLANFDSCWGPVRKSGWLASHQQILSREMS